MINIEKGVFISTIKLNQMSIKYGERLSWKQNTTVKRR